MFINELLNSLSAHKYLHLILLNYTNGLIYLLKFVLDVFNFKTYLFYKYQYKNTN